MDLNLRSASETEIAQFYIKLVHYRISNKKFISLNKWQKFICNNQYNNYIIIFTNKFVSKIEPAFQTQTNNINKKCFSHKTIQKLANN